MPTDSPTSKDCRQGGLLTALAHRQTYLTTGYNAIYQRSGSGDAWVVVKFRVVRFSSHQGRASGALGDGHCGAGGRGGCERCAAGGARQRHRADSDPAGGQRGGSPQASWHCGGAEAHSGSHGVDDGVGMDTRKGGVHASVRIDQEVQHAESKGAQAKLHRSRQQRVQSADGVCAHGASTSMFGLLARFE